MTNQFPITNGPINKREHSAGGCVYKQLKTKNLKLKTLWLVGKHSGYHKWVLPKGLIEQGESPEWTAVREVKEEMGVEARIVGENPIYETKYSYKADFKVDLDQEPERRVKKYQESGGGSVEVSKTVTWYLMEWAGGDPKDHDFEMEEAKWATFEEAQKLLAFEDERGVLTEAQKRLSA